MGIVIVLIFFAAAWLLLIVPRQRELRRHQALMGELAPDDEVIMSSGVYGTIREIDGEFVQLEVAPGVVLKVAKRAIAAMATEPEPEPADPGANGAEGSVVDPTTVTDDDGTDDDETAGRDRPDLTGN